MPRSTSRSSSGKRRAAALSLALVSPLLGVSLGLGSPEDLPMIAEAIEERYPDVEHVGYDELERDLERAPESRTVVLDVRGPEEYAVSHIEGAVRAETLAEALAALADLPRDREIVVYCSVGLRAAELAEELEEKGYTDVKNLRGSLFGWANSGRPLVHDGRPTRKVHPYNGRWGKLLREELRATPGDAPDVPAS